MSPESADKGSILTRRNELMYANTKLPIVEQDESGSESDKNKHIQVYQNKDKIQKSNRS